MESRISKPRCFHLSLGIPRPYNQRHLLPYNRHSQSDAPSHPRHQQAGFLCFFSTNFGSVVIIVRQADCGSSSCVRIPGIFIFHSRHQHIHESFNKCRLSVRTGPQHQCRFLHSSSLRYRFVYLKSIHQNTPMHELVLLLTDYAGNIPEYV